ncbi:MAG: HEPN domain-containing protein [Desulfobacteraceae bacterium]
MQEAPYLKKYKPDEDLINILYNAGLDTKEALNLIKMERPYRRVRNLVDKYYNTYTTQRFSVIDKLFLAYRLKNITTMAQNKSGRKKLKRSVEILVERRHKIVHYGDYNSHQKLIAIDTVQIVKRINDLKLFVKYMDEIIENRMK